MATTRDKVPSSEHEHTGENYQDTPAGMDIDREIDRTDSVSQPKDEQCPDCLKLTDERDQAELSLKFWKQEARNWKEDAKYWKQKYDTWHEQIAETMAKSSVMEKTSDMTSNTKVADMFDVTVKEMWVNLCEDLQDNNKSEIHRITNLSELMQAIYKECTKKVDADTKKLRECSFSINDMVPDEIALAVRMVRKQMCQNESQTTQVIEEIGKIIFDSTIVRRISTSKLKISLNAFIEKVISISWLMVSSDPPLHLNFDVKDEKYEGAIKERFVQYSTEEPINPEPEKEGTVLVVAWPCLELKEFQGKRSNSGYLKKGEVIVRPSSTHVQTNIH